MAAIYRGSTCRLKFKIGGNANISSLGTPTIAISQELAFLSEFQPSQITVDTTNRCVNLDLTETDTLALAENVPTKCQLAFVNENVQPPKVTRFPVHDIVVAETLFENLI